MRAVICLLGEPIIVDTAKEIRAEKLAEHTRELEKCGFAHQPIWMALIGGRWEELAKPYLFSKSKFGWIIELENGRILQAGQIERIGFRN